MITIDGSYGEGGGQILRTSLALSLVTGKPFCLTKIRAGRKKAGLMRQHLTAVNAAVDIGCAEVTGNSIGSCSITFIPRGIKAQKYRFSIGSAGSCTLVLQTILPALMIADGPSEIICEGGTHNPYAPPFDFLEKAFLPIINKMGPSVASHLDQPGFYPAGGGRFTITINPAKRLNRIDIMERGDIIRQRACALVSNLPINIAHRELKVISEHLNWDRECLKAKEVKGAHGPGNVITVEIESEHITEIFSGFGEKAVPAEKVAQETVRELKTYLASDVPVGKYLADQLLIPMAMAGGGAFRTLLPTKHTKTNSEIIRRFIDIAIDMNEHTKNQWEIKLQQ